MNPRSGYSILEVLIAFAVMSMTLAVLLPGQTALLGRAGTASERALAHDLAVSHLETVAILGSADAPRPPKDWRIEQTEAEGTGTHQVTVTVTAANGRILAEVTRTFGVLDEE